MSTIKFNDYNEAYTQTEAIYKMIQEKGSDIVLNLKKICDGLKEKWVADDAPIHINVLATIQNNLKKYFTSSTSMICEVSDRVVDIQTAAHEISHKGSVGENLKDEFTGNDDSEEVLGNKSYKVQSLKDEYDLLDATISEFMKFKNDYVANFEEFFENWQDDPKKKDIEISLTDFISKLDEYMRSMEEVRQALGKVVENTEQLLEG